MNSDLWAYVITSWPGAIAGLTQRGPHDPRVPHSGYNLGYIAAAVPTAVTALRQRAWRELIAIASRLAQEGGLPTSSPPDNPQAARDSADVSVRLPEAIVCAEQVHGRRVAIAQRVELAALPYRYETPYYSGCDALITAEPGLGLMLFYADCCPLILYSDEPRCGGLVHAGWRGAVADIAGEAVRALHAAFGARPENLQAFVGPCICPRCYEIGPEVAAAVTALGLDTPLIEQRREKRYLDLLGLNVALLVRAGVPPTQIMIRRACTRCGPLPFFSYRRDGAQCGRQAALFMLLPTPPSGRGASRV